MRSILMKTALVLLAVSAVCCSGGEESGSGEEAGTGLAERPGTSGAERPRDVSHVVLKAPDGERKTIDDYSGRILMVHFFATWHEDTGRLVEWMNEVQRKFGKNVDVLGLAMDREGRAAVRDFLVKNEVKFEVFYNGEEAASEFGGVRTLPTTYILKRDGTILHRYDGIQRQRVYEDFILAMYRRRM